MSTAFLDEVDIRVTGGQGGNGCSAFRREKYVPFGGPSGGDGGDGGAVVLVASRSVNTLSSLRHRGHYRADGGKAGEGSRRHGRSGGDAVIMVPAGTVVRDAETHEELADLKEDGQRLVVAPGGRGGRGNARFATATQRAPRRCDPGAAGIDRWLHLELRLLADVGLVGLPNAGKSTLISRVSAARPRIAPHPFTTLVPNLGVVDVGDESFVVADIPGLIEGSHLGHGLGDQFLRHVARTSVLLHLVDVSDLAPSPAESLRTIEAELAAFDPALMRRARIVVGTKTDAATSRTREVALKRAASRRGLEALAVSAVSGAGLEKLIHRMAELVAVARAGGSVEDTTASDAKASLA